MTYQLPCHAESRGPCRSDAHLDGHDGDAPGQRADGEVHEGRLGAVGGHDAVDEVRARDEAEKEVGEERYGGIVSAAHAV